jgi:hypothetical protein
MKQEIENESDIDALAKAWDRGSVDKPRIIQRIEDLPDLDKVNGGEIEWVIKGIVAQGALHMITSEPGAGKSTFVAAAGYSISKGLPFMGRATRRCPVLILDAENPLSAICERFNRLRIKTHDYFRAWGQWVGEDPPAAGGAIVLEWVKRCDVKPVIIIDSVIAFHPGAENDSNETRKYMAQYRALTAMGATVLLLHHTGKSETSKDYRGSSDYKASIDIGYKLTNMGDPARLSALELRPFKQRFSVDSVLRILYHNGVFSPNQSEIHKSATETLRDLLKAKPGVTKSQFEALAAREDVARNQAREFLEKGIRAGTVRVEVGMKNRHLHTWAERTLD